MQTLSDFNWAYILRRKLILKDDFVVGNHVQGHGHGERQQVSLSQKLHNSQAVLADFAAERGCERKDYSQAILLVQEEDWVHGYITAILFIVSQHFTGKRKTNKQKQKLLWNL